MSKGINFKKLRNDAGLTLAHLAELSGYDVTDIVRLEQGEKIPPLHTGMYSCVAVTSTGGGSGFGCQNMA